MEEKQKITLELTPKEVRVFQKFVQDELESIESRGTMIDDQVVNVLHSIKSQLLLEYK